MPQQHIFHSSWIVLLLLKLATTFYFIVWQFFKNLTKNTLQSDYNYLLHRDGLKQGTVEFGHAFEHLIIQEILSYLDYFESTKKLSFWHTQNNAYEVDAVIGDAEVAIEIKSSQNINSTHLKGLKAFQEEHPSCKLYVVSMEERPRMFNGVEVWPVLEFIKRLRDNKIILP